MSKLFATWALIVATLGFVATCDVVKSEIINLNFEDLAFPSGGIVIVATPYNANGFTVSTNTGGTLSAFGSSNIAWAGSAALLIGNTQTLTVSQQNGQAFNFNGAVFADLQANTARTVTLAGTKMNGTTVTTTINLDGGPVSLQSFSFSTLTNLSSLQITGRSQWSDGTFEITPATFSAVTANFDSAASGTVGNSYTESNLTFTSPTAMSISSVLGSKALGTVSPGTIVVTPSTPGTTLNLTSFDIASPEASGTYSLVANYKDGSTYESVTFGAGVSDGSFLSFLLNGRTGNIISLAFKSGAGGDPAWINTISANVLIAVSARSIQAILLPSGDYEITFTGILQSSPNLLPSSWQDVIPQPSSPYAIPKASLGTRGFFRAKGQ